jgi:Leucine-rich repeat (LRR) protein
LENIDLSELSSLEEIDFSNGQLKSVVFGEHLKLNQINLKNNPTLQSLNLTGMVELKNLDVSFCGLNDVNVRNLSNLENLNIQNNQLTELDLTGIINLKFFNCNNNNLKSLKVNHLIKMKVLDCSFNQIEELNFENNSDLYDLNCSNNLLNTMNFKNSNIGYLNCSNNLLNTMNFKNSNVGAIEGSNNQIETLDLNWLNLGSLNLKNNQLVHLSLQNSSTDLFGYGYVDLSDNPNLSFICTNDFMVNEWKKYLSNANIQNVKVSDKCYFKPIVSPNPVYENFQITSMRQMKTVRIFNQEGKLMHESHPGNYKAYFNNLSNITKGLYFVEITDMNGEINTTKLIAN